MTQEQIEKAAEELRDSLWDGYANISPDAEWGEVTQAVFKSFLTRFSQQCEADALERAADVAQRAQPPKAGSMIAFRIRSLKPKAL